MTDDIMPLELVIAIDPGQDGALVAQWPNAVDPSVQRCPPDWTGQIEALATLGAAVARHGWRARAVIEQVHAFPARLVPARCDACGHPQMVRQPQGSKSIWAFAWNTAVWHCACYAARIRVIEVTTYYVVWL